MLVLQESLAVLNGRGLAPGSNGRVKDKVPGADLGARALAA